MTWEVNKKYITGARKGISALKFLIIEPVSIKLQLSTIICSQSDGYSGKTIQILDI